MTDRISLALVSLALAAIGLDLMLIQTGFPLLFVRKLADLIEYLAFWR